MAFNGQLAERKVENLAIFLNDYRVTVDLDEFRVSSLPFCGRAGLHRILSQSDRR